MNKIEELEKKVAELTAEIAKLKNENKRWRAECNEKYYYITEFGNVIPITEYKNEADDYLYKIRNYFKTEQEAKDYLEKINTYWELADLAEELNEGKEINWGNEGQYKYYINIEKTTNTLILNGCIVYKHLGQIYCLNEDFLDTAKERIGTGRLIKLFK